MQPKPAPPGAGGQNQLLEGAHGYTQELNDLTLGVPMLRSSFSGFFEEKVHGYLCNDFRWCQDCVLENDLCLFY